MTVALVVAAFGVSSIGLSGSTTAGGHPACSCRASGALIGRDSRALCLGPQAAKQSADRAASSNRGCRQQSFEQSWFGWPGGEEHVARYGSCGVAQQQDDSDDVVKRSDDREELGQQDRSATAPRGSR